MPIFRVRWEELKSVLVKADTQEEAEELALTYFYDSATLDDQNLLETITDSVAMDEEEVHELD